MLQTIVIVLIKNAMVALMLAIGLRTTTSELRATWAERRLVLRALLVLELGVPLLALATVKLLPLGFVATGIIAVMAVCPGAPMIVKLVPGRAVIPVLFAVVSALAPITVVLWVTVLDRVLPHELAIDAGAIARITVLRQLLPLAAGVGIAAILPQAARSIARVALAVFVTGFVLALAVVLAKGAPVLLRIGWWDGLAVMIVFLGSMAMGHVAGRPRLEDRSALTIMAVLCNPALGAAVITESYPGFRPIALLAAYLIVRALLVTPYVLHAKRRAARNQPTSKSGLEDVLSPPAAVSGHLP